jgi:hypothetical protein
MPPAVKYTSIVWPWEDGKFYAQRNGQHLHELSGVSALNPFNNLREHDMMEAQGQSSLQG